MHSSNIVEESSMIEDVEVDHEVAQRWGMSEVLEPKDKTQENKKR